MKVICCADTHFGSSDALGRINPDTGLHTRLEDFFKQFDVIIDYALDSSNEVELVILAGDVFKTRHPTNTQQAQFAKRLRRLNEAKMPTLISTGNHDILVGEGQAHTVEAIKELGLDCITVADKPSTYSYGGHNFVVMPYIYRQRLNLKTNKEALAYYKQTIDDLKSGIDGEAIFVGHQSVEGLQMPSGYIDLDNLAEIVVPQKMLKDFKFCVFGHIHQYQVLSKSPEILYTGPLERLDFSQADKPVGFVVYDTDTNSHEFVELDAVDLYRIYVDLIECTKDFTEEVLESIDESRLNNSIVSLRLKIRETDLAKLNRSAIQAMLDKAKFSAGLKTDVEKTYTSRNSDINESLSAQEALKKYVDSREDLSDIAAELMRVGVNIITVCDARK